MSTNKHYLCKLLFLPILCILTCNAGAAPFQDDWIQTDDNPCKGYYSAPDFTPLSSPDEVTIEADHSEFNPDGISSVSGNVVITQDSRQLKTSQASIYISPLTNKIETVSAPYDIEYSEPDFRVYGRSMEANVKKESFQLRDIYYRLYARHARGYAYKAVINANGYATLTNATYTTCAPHDHTWELKSRSINLSRTTGRGQAKHVRILIKNFPVLYLPYVDFPIDNRRKTGFLYPTYGTSTNSGIMLAFPFYLNIAPNIDATLTPRILSKRGVELQTQMRYLTHHSFGTFLGNILPDDSAYAAFKNYNLSYSTDLSPTDPRLTGLEKGDTRIAVAYKHVTEFNPHITGDIDYNYVGDDNYFIDLGNDIKTASTTQLLQQAQLTYRGVAWYHLFRFQSIQTLYPLNGPVNQVPYRRQPQWAFEANYPHFYQGLNFKLNGDVSRFTHNIDPFTGEIFTEGERYQMRPAISYLWQREWGYALPKVQWDLLMYDLRIGTVPNDTDKPQTPARTIPMYSFDSALFFDRNIRLLGFDLIQTLEPRIYYLYVPFRDQNLYPNFDSGIMNFSYFQLFRDNRFSGKDRVGDTDQITLSILTRILDREGQELFNLGFGEIYFFKKRQVTLCDSRTLKGCVDIEDPSLTQKHSDLIGQMDIYWYKGWSSFGTLEYDPDNNQTNKTSLSLHYRGENRELLNLGYYWIRIDPAESDFATGTFKSLQQTEFSFLWPITHQWSLLGRWHYDLVYDRTISTLAGVEMDSCCTALQFVVSRYLRPTDRYNDTNYATGFYLQFMLKGLSNFSLVGKEQKLISEIEGYKSFTHREMWYE